MAVKATGIRKEARGMSMSILHRDDLSLGGFAGLREHRLVMDPKVFGRHVNPGTWQGIGSFVYLADARFNPKGETTMHHHKEIDVISIMVAGQIIHEGSLEHGQRLRSYNVQVQRAGREGFSHNEINPDDTENRMIQMWVLPETTVEPAGYKLYMPEWGLVTRVYGGSADQNQTFAGNTLIDLALLNDGQRLVFAGPLMAYIVIGAGSCNGEVAVNEGDLISGNHLEITADMKLHMIVVRNNQ